MLYCEWGCKLDLLISDAFAHGASTSESTGAYVPLIFIPAIIIFGLFFVLIRRRKGWTVLVTGGAGYIGSPLVPKLLDRGHQVIVLDRCLPGDNALASERGFEYLREIVGDIRDPETMEEALRGCDAVIHLACISDDSLFDSGLGKAVNHYAFPPLVQAAKLAGVKRFLYTSSCDVYGANDGHEVTEASPLTPHTEFARYKTLCEARLETERAPGFVVCTIRSASVCGYAPRQWLDSVVNAFTDYAVNENCIWVSDGSRKYANIHIEDLTDFYLFLLDQPDARIDGNVYNASGEGCTFEELADIAKRVVGVSRKFNDAPADRFCAHNVSSNKLRDELGFEA